MTQKIRVAFVALVLMLLPLLEAERVNQQFTLTAGSPVRISAQKLLVNRLFIQSRTSNSGITYVMLGVKTTATCSATNAAHLTAELAPGSSTAPGGSFSDPQGANGNSPADSEDMAMACLDTSHTGDVVIVSFWRRL